MSINILGISAFYHDSAAALIQNGEIVAAAQEERFTRKKHDYRFPKEAINYCLQKGDIAAKQLDFVVFYDKPFLKFERILETYLQYAPIGIRSFIKAVPLWIKKKIWMKSLIQEELEDYAGPILFPEHHQSHAASAFYPSPYKEAAIITTDGVGEWTTTSIGFGHENKFEILREIVFPHSLGLLYSAFTYYAGFKVNSGEYKVMGLAPYGEPKYVQTILDNLIDLKEDGSFRLNMDYFNFAAGLTMTNKKFDRLFGGPPRQRESLISQKDMDIARSVQDVAEMAMLRMAGFAKKTTLSKNLCLAGGVALNCVANGKIQRENIFENIWIQPAAGDAGGALGAALSIWYDYLKKVRNADGIQDKQKGSYLGPEFSENEVLEFLSEHEIPHKKYEPQKLYKHTAELLAQENVVGWFQGRMEFGPRALGARSILGDARSPKMQKQMNLKIKYRESFRPFAPAVLAEEVQNYFDLESESPYMLLVADVVKEKQRPICDDENEVLGLEKLNVVRSDIPAVTHVDHTARIQTVHKETNPIFWNLLKTFQKITGCAVVVNTSFNIRGEPIVCTPTDAYKCFMRTEMDYLVISNFILSKKDQPKFVDNSNWQTEFELD